MRGLSVPAAALLLALWRHTLCRGGAVAALVPPSAPPLRPGAARGGSKSPALPPCIGRHILHPPLLAFPTTTTPFAMAGGDGREPSEDWRSFRNRLVAQEGGARDGAAPMPAGDGGDWAHAIWKAEPGCVLLANPTKFRGGQQSYFGRGVILLVEHDDELGSVGFLLNRPTTHVVGDIAPSLALFANCPLHVGGPVGDGLQFIHRIPEVHGSAEVMEGVYYGGDLQHAAYLIRQMGATREGAARLASSFRFFHRYCSWGPRQLAGELCDTTVGAPLDPPSPVWFPAATSPALAFQCAPRGVRARTGSPLWKAILRKAGLGGRVPAWEAEGDAESELVRRESDSAYSDFANWRAILTSSCTSIPYPPTGSCPPGPVPNPLPPGGASVVEVSLLYLSRLHQRLEGGGGGDIAAEIMGGLDALADEARGALGGAAASGTGTEAWAMLAADCVSGVMFGAHAFGVAPDAAEFPENPDHSLLHCLLRERRGGPLVLALAYRAVAWRLGLDLGVVCGGGQRLLRNPGDEEEGPRSPKGRQCQTRNVWPLKRIETQPPEPALLSFSPQGGGEGCFYIDVCDGGAVLTPHQAVEWRMSVAQGGLPTLLHGGKGEQGGGGGAEADEWDEMALLAADTDESVVARLLGDLVRCHLERDWADRSERYSDALRALDAACCFLRG